MFPTNSCRQKRLCDTWARIVKWRWMRHVVGSFIFRECKSKRACCTNCQYEKERKGREKKKTPWKRATL